MDRTKLALAGINANVDIRSPETSALLFLLWIKLKLVHVETKLNIHTPPL